MTDLAARIARLEGLEAARTTAYKYATLVDSLDYEGLRRVFAQDSALTTTKATFTGIEAVISEYKRAFTTAGNAKKHFITNLDVVWLGDDRVQVTSYLLWTELAADHAVLGWGTYIDEMRIEDGKAWITNKIISIDWRGDIRANAWAQ